jgi:hypothetical protein
MYIFFGQIGSGVELLMSRFIAQKRDVSLVPCGFSAIPISRSPLKPITNSPSIPISILP